MKFSLSVFSSRLAKLILMSKRVSSSTFKTMISPLENELVLPEMRLVNHVRTLDRYMR